MHLFAAQTSIAYNNDWQQAPNMAAVLASGLAPEYPQEAAIYAVLVPGAYTAVVTAADLARMKTIFPNGVCDWSRPGVSQVPVSPWASFGPSPKNLITGAARP